MSSTPARIVAPTAEPKSFNEAQVASDRWSTVVRQGLRLLIERGEARSQGLRRGR